MIRIGVKDFDTANQTYIMGILNVTPDSFSDGGTYAQLDSALFRAEQMIAEGADILDVGGESTRPGHIQIAEEEEIERISPVIEKIKQAFQIPVSIDTYKARVASAAIQAGADMINDIWGLQYATKHSDGMQEYDTELADTIRERNVTYCLMHNRTEIPQGDIISCVITELQSSVQTAIHAGISKDKMILDPGIGFAKTVEQNMQILANLDALRVLDMPLLLGASKKSVIGAVNEPPLPIELRQEGTYVTTVLAVMNGYSFVRVHDVAQNKRIIQMTEALCRRQQR